MKATFAMNDPNTSLPSADHDNETSQPSVMRSPIRPSKPTTDTPDAAPALDADPAPKEPVAEAPTNSSSALDVLRQKMKTVAGEFAEGKINRAQFNALYKRYSEQRTIIERLMQRDPENEAWRQVMSTKGYTSFLRSHFEAQPLYYSVHTHREIEPIVRGGPRPADASMVQPLLRAVWQLATVPKQGVGKKALANGEWLVLAVGEHALTAVIFSLEPSVAQARLVRDLHNDFERANQAALARKWIIPDRMVFPQRALTESSL